LAIEEYLNLIDGLLFIGGGFDVHPKRYGQKVHPTVTLNEVRDNFEFEIFLQAIKQKSEMPILGICNGMQLMNIIFGGDCIQHIPDYAKYMNHEQNKNPEFMEPAMAYHDIEINQKTQLFEIAQIKNIKTNSSHHQAVGNLGKNIIASAKSRDGIIEAIEHRDNPFCLGVQWHPEFGTSEIDEKIFTAFIRQCQQNN